MRKLGHVWKTNHRTLATRDPDELYTIHQEGFVRAASRLEMKVKILSYHAVAAWRWDMPEDDDCGICRVQFDGTCPKCKFPGDDCPIIMGQCTHSFHMAVFRIKGTVDQSEVQTEQTAAS
ncbi:hypothetical protein D6C97_02078 [Aureobasidium pullulans]|uniref:Anaphase-promoting complex subunit 11 RING-H2 finger domain-containing protein n=1 Tax=Aureobasidium pullulans TaxID=5580 RepID=A0A4S9BUT2_AURPU|nr:hypothetical protein D6D15_00873 [Aureobasidium pullulans]THY66027.1 hypothetical protein D6C97_02078 [Aureobasidium pullulans]